MKVIIAGSRTLGKQSLVEQAIGQAFNKWISEDRDNWRNYLSPEIVSGGARGVDFCGEQYAKKHNFKLTIFPANWDQYGKAAGIIRNAEMATYADALIAIWDGASPGTKNMIDQMKKREKPYFIFDNSRICK